MNECETTRCLYGALDWHIWCIDSPYDPAIPHLFICGMLKSIHCLGISLSSTWQSKTLKIFWSHYAQCSWRRPSPCSYCYDLQTHDPYFVKYPDSVVTQRSVPKNILVHSTISVEDRRGSGVSRNTLDCHSRTA